MNIKYVYVKVNEQILKDSLKYNNDVILTYNIAYPVFESKIYYKAAKRMNIFYKTKAIKYENYVRSKFYDLAIEQYKYDAENKYPFRAYQAVLKFNITYNDSCIISLYSDKYEYTAGAHGSTLRTSQTWNMQKMRTIELYEFIKYQFDYKAYILKMIKEQIESEPEFYFDDWENLMISSYNDKNFYATYEGIIIYYQQYDIAPYSSGIREFLLPYSGYVIDPKYMCSR